MKKKKHVVAIDIIRIIAGIGVILIHVTDPFITYPVYRAIGGSSWWIVNVINVFFRACVPLFVMISGFLLLDLSQPFLAKDFIKRRFLKIGIPSFVWIVVYLALFIQRGQITSVYTFFESIISLNIYHLYFVILILELYLITPILQVLMRAKDGFSLKPLVLTTFLFTSVISGTNALFPESQIPLTKNIVTVFLPFIFYYLLGSFLRNVKLSPSTTLALLIVYGYAAIFIAIISNGDVTAYSREFEGLPMIGMSTIAFIVLLQTNFLSIFKKPWIVSVLRYISSLVFGAYLIHVIVIFLLDRFFPILPGNAYSPLWLFVLLKVGLVLICSFVLVAVLKKLPFSRFLFS